MDLSTTELMARCPDKCRLVVQAGELCSRPSCGPKCCSYWLRMKHAGVVAEVDTSTSESHSNVAHGVRRTILGRSNRMRHRKADGGRGRRAKKADGSKRRFEHKAAMDLSSKPTERQRDGSIAAAWAVPDDESREKRSSKGAAATTPTRQQARRKGEREGKKGSNAPYRHLPANIQKQYDAEMTTMREVCHSILCDKPHIARPLPLWCGHYDVPAVRCTVHRSVHKR